MKNRFETSYGCVDGNRLFTNWFSSKLQNKERRRTYIRGGRGGGAYI